MSRTVTHLVVVAREGEPTVTEFGSLREAADFFDRASWNWSESYLALVVAGPGRPLNVPSPDPHCRPDVVALRDEAGRSGGVCSDAECDLSGGYAHAGPCEPCGCPLRHAIEECPQRWNVRMNVAPDYLARVAEAGESFVECVRRNRADLLPDDARLASAIRAIRHRSTCRRCRTTEVPMDVRLAVLDESVRAGRRRAFPCR